MRKVRSMSKRGCRHTCVLRTAVLRKLKLGKLSARIELPSTLASMLCSKTPKSTKSYWREGHLSLIHTEIPIGQVETLLISDIDRIQSRSHAIISCTTLGIKNMIMDVTALFEKS